MRIRLSLILAILGVALGLAVVAEAGRYHRGTQNNCADCHIMHGTQRHNLTDGGTTGYTVPGTVGPNLTRAATVNALCTSCHDAQTFAPDVVGTNTNAAADNVYFGRSAGALNLNATTGAVAYANWKGHSLNFNGTAPGTNATIFTSLKCTNCHDQHGNANYRNLNAKTDAGTAIGTTSITDTLATTDIATANVRINVAAYSVGPTGNPVAATRAPYYGAYPQGAGLTGGNLYYEPNNNYTLFCVNCHTGLDSGSKHPALTTNNVGGTNLTNYNLTAGWNTFAKVKVTATSHANIATTGPTGASPFCATCHKPHGNDNAFGLIYMLRTDANTAVTEQGSTGGSNEGHLCSQCHTQAN